MTERATDHYSYLWPRDGAFVANAFDRAGYPDISRRFFSLSLEIVHERGYFLQKYNPDGTLGSGWHSHWDNLRQRELTPIQPISDESGPYSFFGQRFRNWTVT